jgi:ATP-dependent DNA helicase DinG
VVPTADDASAVAGALGKVVARLPGGGEARPGQVRMAEAVARALLERRHLVVQAGTGTGKSLAYLVPAILSGQRVVVATATKALQDQLANKDLPFLTEHLGWPFEAAVLKGRSNYLCKQRGREVAGGDGQLELDADELTGLSQEVALMLAWAAESPTGDRAELDFEPRPRAWAQLSVSAVECPGANKCPIGDDCFAEKARRRAAEADVIVVNTALYGMHLLSGGHLLPEHDVVVFDEAHHLEDVAATSLGLELAAGRFTALGRMSLGLLDQGHKEAASAVEDAGAKLEAALIPLHGAAVAGVADGEGLADEGLSAAVAVAAERVRALSSALRGAGGDDPGDGRKARAQQAASHLAGDLAVVAGLPPTHVAWVEGQPHSPVLRIALVDVARLLAEQLWGEITAVLTSATIPPGLPDRLGLPKAQTDVVDVGSPFRYREQALLYVPKRMPPPPGERWEAAVIDELAWLIDAAGGRALALFTSYRGMERAAQALAGQLPGRLLTQLDLPKPALVKAFTEDETSSLFATMGFWQGIDVPGPSLSLVCIDRLPFPRPDEPLTQARRDRAGPDAFNVVDIPRAATLLAQGAGRLIRTAEDRGVVAVLDPRLATRRYRAALLLPVPPMKRSISRDEVAAFLAPVKART